jgi:hypothetical protein
MKTYGAWRYRSIILDQLHTWVTLIPGKEAAVPIGEVWWSPEPVWTLWRKEKSLALAGNKTPAVQPVACHCTD